MTRAVVILPSTTYRAGDFIDAAESLGIDLVVASENPPPFDMGDRYIQIDCSDPARAAEEVLSLGDEVPLDGIVAADDGGVVVAAIAGTRLGLAANDPTSASATRDKLAMRRALDAGEVPQPRYAEVSPGDDPLLAAGEIGYPVVVKPLDRSASQGVIRADDPHQLSRAVARLEKIVGSGATILVEEFLPGEEVALEGLLRNGSLSVLAIFDKPEMSQGPYFPETIFVTPSRHGDDVQDECVRVAAEALGSLGLRHGPVHVELRVSDGIVRVIEVAARSIGGLCSRSLNFGLMGTTLEALILRNAVGMDKPELRREHVASGVLMIPIPSTGRLERVRGVDQVRAIEGITGVDITVPPGGRVVAPPEGDRYLGFVFARGNSPEEVEQMLVKARELLVVDISDPKTEDNPKAEVEV